MAVERNYFKSSSDILKLSEEFDRIKVMYLRPLPNSIVLSRQIGVDTLPTNKEFDEDALMFFYKLVRKYKFNKADKSNITYLLLVTDKNDKRTIGMYTIPITELQRLNNRDYLGEDIKIAIDKPEIKLLPIKEVLKNIKVLEKGGSPVPVDLKRTKEFINFLNNYDFPSGIESKIEDNFYNRNIIRKNSRTNSVRSYFETTSSSDKAKGILDYSVSCTDGTNGFVRKYPYGSYHTIYWKNYDKDSSLHNIVNGSIQQGLQKACH